MSNFHDTKLHIEASSTGGADVDGSARLLIDGIADQDSDVTLVDVHRSSKTGKIRAMKKGNTKLRLIA